MATTLRELLIRVGVDANNAKASLAQVDAGVNRVKSGFQNLATFAAAATAAIGSAGLGALLLASQAAATSKTLDLQSRALGVQVERYQELTQAAATFGVEQQDLAQVLTKTTLALQAGADGGEAQADAFKKLGLDMKAMLGLRPDERLLRLSDAFRAVSSDVERLSLANALFGDDLAVKLLPLLTSGSQQLNALGAEARELGIILNRESIDASLKFAKAQGEVLRLIEALQLRIGVALSPALTRLAERLVAWYKANEQVIGQQLDHYAEVLSVGLERIADSLSDIDKTIGGAEGWAKLAEYMALLAGARGAQTVAGQLFEIAAGAKDSTFGIAQLTPALMQGASKFTQYTMAVLRLSHTLGLLRASRQALGNRLEVLGDLGSVVQILRTIRSLGLGLGLSTILSQAGVPMAAMAASAVTLKAALTAVAVVAAKVVAVLAVVTSLFLIFEDVWTWLRGGDSVYGRMLEKMKESGGVLGALARLYEAMGNIANAVISRIVQYFELVGTVLGFVRDAFVWVGKQIFDFNAALGEVMLPYLERVAEALGVEIPAFVYDVSDALKAWRDGLIDIIDLLSITLNMIAKVIGTDAADAAMMGAGGVTDANNQGAQALKVANNVGGLFYDDQQRAQMGGSARRGLTRLGRGIGTGTDLAALGFQTTAQTARSALETVGGWAYDQMPSRQAALAGLSSRPTPQAPVTVNSPVTITIGTTDERTADQIKRVMQDQQTQMLRALQNEQQGAEL